MQADINLVNAFGDLLTGTQRYKVFFGGRGGAKSWQFVRAALIHAVRRPVRILCAREIQISIRDSVHQLIKDQIDACNLGSFFKVTQNEIVGLNGSLFIFKGLRHNVNEIKSLEGIDYCLVFEANKVSKASWEILIPTIRKEGSEIWIEFNPELDTDETYKRFVLHPPGNALVRKVNWSDNPYISSTLLEEKDYAAAHDPDGYLTIWEGHTRQTLDGAIYAAEIRQATADGRIGRLPWTEELPVHTFWDLGWADCTSIWFAQKVGFNYHLIDFYQNQFQKLGHYLKVIQDKPYLYGIDYLPHDADHESLGADSIAKTMKNLGRKVQVVPRVPQKAMELKATREIFSRCWFDEAKCQDGLQALRRYRYEKSESGQYGVNPHHDENSHAADAFGQFARSINRRAEGQQNVPRVEFVTWNKGQENTGWMG